MKPKMHGNDSTRLKLCTLLSSSCKNVKDRNKLLHSITSEQNQQHHWDQIPDTNPKCHFHLRTVNSNQQNE